MSVGFKINDSGDKLLAGTGVYIIFSEVSAYINGEISLATRMNTTISTAKRMNTAISTATRMNTSIGVDN